MADTTQNPANDAADNAQKLNNTQPKGNKAPKLAPDAVYDVSAYTQGVTSWELFNFAPELVATALKLAGKEKCTLTEAKAIVKEFAEREVK